MKTGNYSASFSGLMVLIGDAFYAVFTWNKAVLRNSATQGKAVKRHFFFLGLIKPKGVCLLRPSCVLGLVSQKQAEKAPAPSAGK
ncbi:hypothetical protein ACD591_10330 [Rufibacter glacialis]|uniref:Uncharacterized protein n=1 Tax=Rufibacter glacialis TaxID=1259555 RepID=A0A5M8QAE9_9BACT|nr:hypothetical protein [Rufibacter glacialis]KAA6431840.1 hypothetical protein FOE74_17155 [Rufibacter glacialis]